MANVLRLLGNVLRLLFCTLYYHAWYDCLCVMDCSFSRLAHTLWLENISLTFVYI
jgi:hypothetical protein